ncbi:hypothetical protein [Streptomyces mirabilis]|uniref:hypothetical protein n=1 Tax=Streptomyces mirabilis TaxID=68239 RepID=UPI00364BB1F0
MNREERRRILGDEVIAHIHELVAAAPEPPPELVEELRRIFFGPRAAPVEPDLAVDAKCQQRTASGSERAPVRRVESA